MNNTTDGKMTIKILQEKHVEDGVRILTKNFISSNPIWKHYKLPYDDVLVIMRGKLLKALQYDQSFVIFYQTQVLYEGEKIIGLNVHLDIFDYVKLPNMPNNLEFFKKISKVGEILQGSVDLSTIKRGDLIVGVFIVIEKDYSSKGYSVKFIRQSLKILKATGWETFYARSSNVYSRKGLQRLGAQLVKQYELVDGELKEKFWLMKIDLTRFGQGSSKLKSTLEQKKVFQPKL